MLHPTHAHTDANGAHDASAVNGEEDTTAGAMPERQRAERIAALVDAIGAIADPTTRAQTEELVAEVLALYGDGLARIMELTAASNTAGESLIEVFASDELVGSLLLLHGLHPLDLPTRVGRAVDTLRPYLASLGAEVELREVAGGAAHLRLRASGRGCSSGSTASITHDLEEALYAAAPELERLVVEGTVEPPPRLITLSPSPARRARSPAAGSSAGPRGSGA